MKKTNTPIWKIAFMLLALVTIIMLTGCSEQIVVMNPKGPIGQSQKDLIIIASVLCGIILVPVLLLTAWIVWRYRDRPNSHAAYKPNWSHSTLMESIWWGIPIIVIIILGTITVRYTYALEPTKPIESSKKAITIQATSLDWKWLFTYPEQGIATVNYLKIPEDVPIKFELTSDAPMNSFWIPQLGGQMYTMSGMAMTLYLQADEQGTYYGSGANFSGERFADMTFDVVATSEQEFESWVDDIKKSAAPLTMDKYNALAQPASSEVLYYSSFPDNLFYNIVNKYAVGGHGHQHGVPSNKDEKSAPTASPAAPHTTNQQHSGH